MGRMPKLVVSHELTEPGWYARVIRDIREEIAQAKATAGGDIVVIGGAGVAQSFLRLGLVDHLRIMVTPLLLGGGIRLFDGEYARTRLERTGCIPVDTGSTILEYTIVRDS
jgi:dihydrofolate reductase